MAQGSNPWGAADGAARQAFWGRMSEIIRDEDRVLPTVSGSGASAVSVVRTGELEPLLKAVVAEAQRATAASGAAIALVDGKEFFCRAVSGPTAPVVGSRVDARSGLSGQCIRSGMAVRCDETEFDARANAAACRELGIRSVLAVPVISAGTVIGVLEVFAPKPAAFSDAHANVLQALAERIVSRHVAPAAAWPAEPVRRETSAASAKRLTAAVPKTPAGALRVNLRGPWLQRKPLLISAAVVLIAGAVVTVALRTSTAKARLQTTVSAAEPSLPPAKVESHASADTLAAPVASDKPSPFRHRSAVSKMETSAAADPVAGQPEATTRPQLGLTRPQVETQPDVVPPPVVVADLSRATGGERATISEVIAAPATAVDLTPRVSKGTTAPVLMHRVTPQYPAMAKLARVEGPVVVAATIGRDGKVREVRPIRGNSVLLQAAVAAVRDWRYRPSELNGQPVEFETQITLNFSLGK